MFWSVFCRLCIVKGLCFVVWFALVLHIICTITYLSLFVCLSVVSICLGHSVEVE